MTSATAVETASRTKRFGERVAVDGLDLRVRRGEVYGLLCPDGPRVEACGDMKGRCCYSPVGTAGFEPAASCSQSRRATRLRHVPRS